MSIALFIPDSYDCRFVCFKDCCKYTTKIDMQALFAEL